MPKTCFWNLGKWARKRGNVADDSGVELNEMNSAIPTESTVKPEYSSKSTKGMLLSADRASLLLTYWSTQASLSIL